MNLPHINRSSLVVGCTLIVLLSVMLVVISTLWGMRSDYAAEVDRLEPQIARLQGIQLSKEQLEMSGGMLAAGLGALAYPSSGETAMVTAAMQQNIRQVMGDAGFSVSGSQILPATREGNLQLLHLDLTVSGTVESLDLALLRLRDLRPVVIVKSAELKPSRLRRQLGKSKPAQNARQITGRFELLSLRRVE